MTFEKIQSHAKINLFLDVLSKRQDGYHEIYSLISKIDLHDDIEIEKSNSLEIIRNQQILSNSEKLLGRTLQANDKTYCLIA